jgi:Protein of unknown function (DUF3738)
MARRVAWVSWMVLLTGAVWLAGTGSGLAQAAAEAAAAHAAASSTGGATKATGNAIGSVFERTGAKLETSTTTSAASAGAKTTKVQRAPSGSTLITPASISASGAQPGIVTGAPHIHFDVVSFKRCAGGGSTTVDLPTDGDYVASHCQPLLRMIDFAYTGAPALDRNLSGYPSWVETDPYDFQANVAAEDTPTWQKMDLGARRLAVRRLLAEELKLKIHADTTPKPGKADGIVVDHIERPTEN